MHSLPQRLREATRNLHREAEGTPLMRDLLRGALPLARYRALLTELLRVYESLEAAMSRHAGLPWLAGLDGAALARVPGLRADLADTAPPAAPAHRATATYVARLQALSTAADPALLGHVYTRYLGDLHGGQVLRRVVQRHYPGQGTAFHEFGPPARQEALRDQLGAALASARLTADEQDRVVEEACWSFRQHRVLFEALDRG